MGESPNWNTRELEPLAKLPTLKIFITLKMSQSVFCVWIIVLQEPPVNTVHVEGG